MGKKGSKHPDTGLTFMQQIFVDIYAGDSHAAAKLAGYANPMMEGSRLMRQPHIIAALDDRDHNKHVRNIASREERQAFWTSVMRDKKEAMSNRLKAADSLGRSEADFVDRMQLEIGMGEQLKKMSDEEIVNKIKMLEDSGIIEMIQDKSNVYEPA